MNRREALTGSAAAIAGLAFVTAAGAQDMDDQSKASLDTVMAFMGAMGGGDMETVTSLMADDMVWHNEGDPALPWIGTWDGK